MNITKEIKNFTKQPHSLTKHLLLTIAVFLIIPFLMMIYDVVFATRSDQTMFLDKEEHLAALVNEACRNMSQKFNQQPGLLVNDQDTFTVTVSPMISGNPGIRFGFYRTDTDNIYVKGFLHNYRRLSTSEEKAREKDIYKTAYSGIQTALDSKQSISKITGETDDQVFQYFSPVTVNNKIVAVFWAEERLNPVFAQSRSFRLIIRYLVFSLVVIAGLSSIKIINSLNRGVVKIKDGLNLIKQDFDYRLPTMSGELGEIATAVNEMALDLAEKRQLEENLRISEHQAALGRLVTGLAHELRNPIGIVQATVQLMESDFNYLPGLYEYTSVIKGEVERQNRVIKELLSYGRPSKQVKKEQSINLLLEQILVFTEPLMRKHHIQLTLSFSEDLPNVFIDAEKMKQVFVNLILNGVEAMLSGGNFNLATSLEENYVLVELADSGEGIDPENLEQIFYPFFTTKEFGTGLGLSNTKQIVEMHQGKITVDSIKGQGTTFRVYLPVFKGEEAPVHGTENTGD